MFQAFLDQFRNLGSILGRLGAAIGSGLRWWFDGARQVGSQMRDGLALLGQGLLQLLLLPYTLFLALVRGLRALARTGEVVERSVSAAEKNLRSSVVDLEESLKSQPDQMKGRWRRWGGFLRAWFGGRPAWQRHTLRALVVLFCLALVSAYPAWRWFKSWRAERLLQDANELVSEGRYLEAYFKGQAAYNLDPASPVVLAELVELSRGLRGPNTLAYGQRLLETGTASSGAIALLTEEAQDRRQLPLARAYLKRLEELEPDHPELTRLRIQLALLSRNQSEAFQLAREASRDPEVDRRVFIYYVQLALNSEDPMAREALIEELVQRAEEATERGLLACVFLLNPALATTEAPPPGLIERILSHPEAGREERLAARQAELAFDLRSFAEIGEAVRSEFSLDEVEGRVAYASWLFQNELFAELSDAFDRPTILENRPLTTLYTLSLIRSGRGQTAVELLRSADAVVLPEIERLILEARAHRELGRDEAYASAVERAIARAEESQFTEIERLVRQLGDTEFLRPLYERFAKIPGTAQQSNANLLILGYRAQDEALLEAVTNRSRVESFQGRPIAQGLLAYLKGLSDEEVPANIRAAEQLVVTYPTVIDFRVALAVNYFRAGYLTEAAAVLEDTGMTELGRMPGMYAVALAILEAVDQVPTGLPSAEEDGLLPAEARFVESIVPVS